MQERLTEVEGRISDIEDTKQQLVSNCKLHAFHAFISSRLDYCNALYAGLTKQMLNKLQLIQNAAARIVTRTSKCNHNTPVIKSLHWLPVKQRIEFKILLLVFKSLNGLAPPYISDLIYFYDPARCLRSSSKCLLTSPRINTNDAL